ncbi:MAG: hypothetical protein VX498_03645, partial [Myxococcota bacterium]|nr:hypothetical protein [Myxococcota bacterium]
ASEWVWETSHPDDRPSAAISKHLASCPSCRTELEARRSTSVQLRKLRDSFEEEPPPGLDRLVLDAASAAVAARESGTFAEMAGELSDEMTDTLVGELTDQLAATMSGEFSEEIAESIAEDFGDEIAALTTSRLIAQGDLPPESPPISPREVRRQRAARTEATGGHWQPPRASTRWLISAATVLVAVGSLAFLGGRWTAGQSPLPIHTTIATPSNSGLKGSRIHDVRLSPGAVKALEDGNTYILTGPVGGPYEVAGVVGWETMDTALQTNAQHDEEVVIAVGPAGGWSRGARLAVSELSHPGVEIIGRRALPEP